MRWCQLLKCITRNEMNSEASALESGTMSGQRRRHSKTCEMHRIPRLPFIIGECEGNCILTIRSRGRSSECLNLHWPRSCSGSSRGRWWKMCLQSSADRRLTKIMMWWSWERKRDKKCQFYINAKNIQRRTLLCFGLIAGMGQMDEPRGTERRWNNGCPSSSGGAQTLFTINNIIILFTAATQTVHSIDSSGGWMMVGQTLIANCCARKHFDGLADFGSPESAIYK